jgi:hypothetical protein
MYIVYTAVELDQIIHILRTKQKTVDWVYVCMRSIFYTCPGRERETVGMVNRKLLDKNMKECEG